jgi:hypothetical protein
VLNQGEGTYLITPSFRVQVQLLAMALRRIN